jgi:hypothetical protein
MEAANGAAYFGLFDDCSARRELQRKQLFGLTRLIQLPSVPSGGTLTARYLFNMNTAGLSSTLWLVSEPFVHGKRCSAKQWKPLAYDRHFSGC